jgi:hypothetical protein
MVIPVKRVVIRETTCLVPYLVSVFFINNEVGIAIFAVIGIWKYYIM